MIEIIFYYGTEVILVRIKGNNLEFANTSYGNYISTIDGLAFSYEGVIKEFPDLKDKDDWRTQAIQRFKNKIASFNNEEEISTYIMSDLQKFGYVPKYKQKQGFRREVLS